MRRLGIVRVAPIARAKPCFRSGGRWRVRRQSVATPFTQEFPIVPQTYEAPVVVEEALLTQVTGGSTPTPG
jgi:hypothetical protein